MVFSLPRTMPPIDESIRSSPIGPRLTAAMAKLAETMAKYYPDSTSYTPPPPNESMDTLADVMAKLEIASKRLATSTAHLISITTKTTTLNYTSTRIESKDDTINNTHRPTIIDGEATTCKNDTKVVTQTPKIEKVTTQNTTTVKVNTPVTTNESKDHTDNTKTNHTKTTTEVVNETSSRFSDIKLPVKSSPMIMSLAPISGSPNTSASTNGASHDLNEAAWLKVGVLLSGPPGNGKTLFAQTLAKESEMPFMFASSAEFTDSEKSGAARINQIFSIARSAFIFVYQIDKRETGVDRFSLRQAVIFICATNRPDELDLEFVQAGCINCRLYIGLPDANQRVQISDVHNIGKQLAEDVNLVFWAEIRNLVNEAGIMAFQLRSSPKVHTSSPLVSPSSIINVPRELYSIDVAAT
ncbi:ATP-dependent zinc metalloprotease FTSH 12, chloroplastic, partial [Tanacetum coccineum]